jgi:hypothetical protein
MDSLELNPNCLFASMDHTAAYELTVNIEEKMSPVNGEVFKKVF